MLWLPLIERLIRQVSNFAEQLATSVLDRLESSGTDDYQILSMDSNLGEADYKYAVYTWLENVLGVGSKKIVSSLSSGEATEDEERRAEIIKNRIAFPTNWYSL